jgi:hypothetical protein
VFRRWLKSRDVPFIYPPGSMDPIGHWQDSPSATVCIGLRKVRIEQRSVRDYIHPGPKAKNMQQYTPSVAFLLGCAAILKALGPAARAASRP